MSETLDALRQQVRAWAAGASPDIRVMIYPPEFEASMLHRLPAFAHELANDGIPVDLVDLGQAFAQTLDADARRRAALVKLEQAKPAQAAEDFGVLARRVVHRVLQADLPDGTVCRVLCNVGALATVVSYSAITNEYVGSTERRAPATVIAFPGEGDDRSLNLLNLRADTNYRVARI